ncbi:TIGR01457 family HAD-type hydrolase [Heyndrickxia oleronia]|jgi:4-nitrophenyl phosphatase|uniref:HAD family hydrolase n=1 Tax=Heyndrickxia oleronia TaxID=38875 RepID=A0A8E2I7J2_9BACI|nr:TIGR01457 family HAD-type hydrolase [Heyndrickxia oleronia]NYV67997.1 TIGR01457 family HAD-type hydrolase [Bacillus sp. Gen3]MCI1591591.1 TIGR01457 family HAD-type hydrolase [Heyndrickxia oleronia]MCI1613023.1 TIGR01457 family HAD-type hydrolase [Heyndrickxia oleronia]MCI1744250.1 TIGR01457 family HAD-type hydrolase [Heyndrickxia oleronia]MCI1760862.1 TIGR01457 family HAD-type hydrolase [Heyndrickxia oleronia]
MKQYKGYLIDLDGTMYRGSEKIEAAGHFIHRLRNKGIPYLFVTNNSSRTPEEVAKKLREFDIPAEDDQVFTTSMATAEYMYGQNKNGTVYAIGETGLLTALKNKGFSFDDQNPDFVVVGIDREINYEKLSLACLAVRKGATFISTNADIALPTERGFLPGNGSITSVITVSTQTTPIFIGKPESIIMNQALAYLGTAKEDTIMVGDFYETDILAGIRAGMDTLLVHTGVTTKEDLLNKEKQPTYSIDSLNEWEC